MTTSLFDGTQVTGPWTEFWEPRGNATSRIKGIFNAHRCCSNEFSVPNSSGIGSNAILFTALSWGTLPLSILELQLKHIHNFPATVCFSVHGVKHAISHWWRYVVVMHCFAIADTVEALDSYEVMSHNRTCLRNNNLWHTQQTCSGPCLTSSWKSSITKSILCFKRVRLSLFWQFLSITEGL